MTRLYGSSFAIGIRQEEQTRSSLLIFVNVVKDHADCLIVELQRFGDRPGRLIARPGL